MTKTRLLILAGGRSEEHEVSIVSAKSVLHAIAGSDIDASVIVVTRQGRWLPIAESQRALAAGAAVSGGEVTLRQAHITDQFDVVFPLIHGPFGEDGTVQGMLELAHLPYIGAGVLASALCMDKAMSKEVLRANHVPQVPYVLITAHMWKHDPKRALAEVEAMPGPWFVKPANLGSSVGISKVKKATDLAAAITAAMAFDRRVVVEQGVDGARELEVAILGNDAPRASTVGEITYQAEFYDYATKYTEGRAQLHIPAQVSADVISRVQNIALQAYGLLDCAGFARIDFFYQAQSDQLWLNEINTIPGFTPMSMFPKLWEHAGIPYNDLIKQLVQLAIERHRQKATAGIVPAATLNS